MKIKFASMLLVVFFYFISLIAYSENLQQVVSRPHFNLPSQPVNGGNAPTPKEQYECYWQNLLNPQLELPESIKKLEIKRNASFLEKEIQKFKSEAKERIKEEEHNLRIYDLRIEAFEAHQITTNSISVLVFVLVFLGVVLSIAQFRQDARQKKANPQATTFKINKNGIEMSSSVIGLIILGISIVFFYVYVGDVYKLEELERKPVPIQQVSKG